MSVEPIPEMAKANPKTDRARKTARVTLRTAPNAPVAFALGNHRLNASSSSSRTQPSSSDESAERAAAPPTRPSAQAAYPGSVASSANFALNGHTSWVFYRFTRFRFKLTTGRNAKKIGVSNVSALGGAAGG